MKMDALAAAEQKENVQLQKIETEKRKLSKQEQKLTFSLNRNIKQPSYYLMKETYA